MRLAPDHPAGCPARRADEGACGHRDAGRGWLGSCAVVLNGIAADAAIAGKSAQVRPMQPVRRLPPVGAAERSSLATAISAGCVGLHRRVDSTVRLQPADSCMNCQMSPAADGSNQTLIDLVKRLQLVAGQGERFGLETCYDWIDPTLRFRRGGLNGALDDLGSQVRVSELVSLLSVGSQLPAVSASR